MFSVYQTTVKKLYGFLGLPVDSIDMENTDKILFEDDEPQWFIALGDRWVGPLAASDVYQRIQNRELSFAHYIWKEGQSDWKRICDVKTFQVAVPKAPAAKPSKPSKSKSSKKTPPPPTSHLTQPKEWFLYYSSTQFGPFSESEIERFLEIGKIHGRVHIWKDGMSNWDLVENIQLFAPIVKELGGRRGQKHKISLDLDNKDVKLEQRRNLRAPLVAKIVMASGSSSSKSKSLGVSVGVCRDISTGGMQVLTDKIPGKVGAHIKLNVSPSDGSSKSAMEPFVAEGVIVRILEDGRGFSFRFEKLNDQARESIESYIDANQ